MKKVFGLALSLLFASTACTTQEASEEEELGTQTDDLWLATGAKRWPGGTVPVCFSDAGGVISAANRATMQSLIMQWDNGTPVKFTGFGTCPSPLTAGRVAIKKNGALTFLGQSVDSAGNPQFGYNSSRANVLELRNVNPPDAKTVVHEMGHALGFVHEHKDDGTCNQRTSGGSQLTPWDEPNSIMSQTGCNGAVSTLSTNDVLGVRKAYAMDTDGNSSIHTYNTDPGNIDGDAVHSGTFLMCPGPFDAIVGVEQWENGSHTIQCAAAPGWITDVSGTHTATTTSTNNKCPDGYVAIGADFTNNKWYCKAVYNLGGAGTVSTSNQYGHFEMFGTRTEIHNCQSGATGFVHGGNLNYGAPIAGQAWNFSCYNQ